MGGRVGPATGPKTHAVRAHAERAGAGRGAHAAPPSDAGASHRTAGSRGATPPDAPTTSSRSASAKSKAPKEHDGWLGGMFDAAKGVAKGIVAAAAGAVGGAAAGGTSKRGSRAGKGDAPAADAESGVTRLGSSPPPSAGAGAPPRGVKVEQDGGTRVVTINIHQAVPASRELGNENETEAALQDVARWIRTVDADVVLVQELDHDVPKTDGSPGGVPEQASRLYDLIGATDGAYTPALRHGNGDQYGTGIYTRNGYQLGSVANVDLTNTEGDDGELMEDRSVGVADVIGPSGGHVTVLNTHVALNRGEHNDQAAQLEDLGRIIEDIRADGALTYRDAITGAQLTASGFDTSRVLIGGDFNAAASTVRPHLEGAGMTNVLTPLAVEMYVDPLNTKYEHAFDPTAGDNRIDHVLTSDGIRVDDVEVQEVPEHDLDERVTDHRGVIVDLEM